MIVRLWFVVSLIWAGMLFFNAMTREVPRLTGVDYILIFGPFALGLLIRVAWRYVWHGPRRHY